MELPSFNREVPGLDDEAQRVSVEVPSLTVGYVQLSGNSGWWIIETVESYNGHRYQDDFGNFTKWFSQNAFGGTNYSNTPIGAVSSVDEPDTLGASNPQIYFGLWAA